MEEPLSSKNEPIKIAFENPIRSNFKFTFIQCGITILKRAQKVRAAEIKVAGGS